MSIPALQPEREPTRLTSVRMTDFEHLVIRCLARKERLFTRDAEPNVTAMVQVALAFMIRYMPADWRPENGKILPEPDHLQGLVKTASQLGDSGSHHLAVDGLASVIAVVLQGEAQTDEQIIAAVSRFPA